MRVFRGDAAEGPKVVYIAGNLDEKASFAQLRSEIAGDAEVVLDLGNLERMNSAGVRNWISFARDIPNDMRVVLVRCPVFFVRQISMVSRFLGGTEVGSLYLPFYCEACDDTDEALYDAAGLSVPLDLREVTCACGEPMAFDEIEENYLRFLKRQSASE